MEKRNQAQKWPDFRFNVAEIAGSIGDYGTLFPIVLGVSLVSNVNLGHILLFFSLWYIITGLYFRMPVPVEPMKAIGAVAIAGGLSGEEIAASGMILGVLFLVLGWCKGMKFLRAKVPASVTRGIQLGLALILLKTAFQYVTGDYIFAIICILIIVLFLILSRFLKNIPDVSAIVILLIGIGAGIFASGIPNIQHISVPGLILPGFQDFLRGGWLLAIPQAPLTITNAILATSLLMGDLVHREVDPDKLSVTIGLMNLSSVPFGGFPMCTGAGGLAAQYRFGARTGGSNIISGIVLLPVALFFASPGFIEMIPVGVFGALLIFVAFELGKHSLKTESYLVTGVMAILALITSITIAFVVGILIVYIMGKIRKHRDNRSRLN